MMAVARLLLLLAVIAIVGCAGASRAPAPAPARSVDPATIRLWTGWAERAQQIASVTEQMYRSRGVPLDQAEEQLERAQVLAVEIRNAESSSELVLRLADDLDQFAKALEFALELARNSGHPALIVEIPSLSDSLTDLAGDAAELDEALETR